MIATFSLLTFAIVALWIGADERGPMWRRWLWLIVFAAALASALLHGIVQPIALVWIAGMAGATFAFGNYSRHPGVRIIAALAIVVLATGLMTHQLPGFANPRVIAPLSFSADGVPYRLHLNFDKTLAGLFILGFCHARIAAAAHWRDMLRGAAPIAAATIGVVMLLALLIGYIRFEPKFPPESPLWLWVNLCFTCVAEEAAFRGFIQAQLQHLWRNHAGGKWFALAIASVLFGFAHAAGGIAYVALATIAGLGYGGVYLRTGRIEASILTHFALNAAHFFGFTYPALQRGP